MTIRMLVGLMGLAWALCLGGCDAPFGMTQSVAPSGGKETSGLVPCTDQAKCCTRDLMRCSGDPDTGATCRCEGLWDCGQNPRKCEQQMPVPTDEGRWTCAWTATQYRCTTAEHVSLPSGTGGWTCQSDVTSMSTSCTKAVPPNPYNSAQGLGSWTCQVESLTSTLSCERAGTDSSTSQPEGKGNDSDSDTDNDTDSDSDTDTDSDTDSDNEGTDHSGGNDTRFLAPPTCVAGQRAWCDGPVYCGWGVVTCGPDGTWEKDESGELRCIEITDGRRPATTCACYAGATYNAKCCERPDCIIPDGTDGQICPRSPGRLCDYCNPENPECIEAGSFCMAETVEAFCTRACTEDEPCPSGYTCESAGVSMDFGTGVEVQVDVGAGYCQPSDGSCL